jgi:aryl-alcohol dehydrogenase-like predicted oxidoreductase
MDHAVANGVNFFDTAEMYPIATRPETYGHTEEIIGDWLKTRNDRNQLVIGTKVCGPGRHHIRDGRGQFTRNTINTALEGSLKRLRIDSIDLYQLHWPDRGWEDFQNLGQTTPIKDSGADRAETIAALDELVQAGKIRAWGVSNESAWGVMDFVAQAKTTNAARPASIQNAYNLLNRKFEFSLSEIAFREDVGLLAYAPIAAGSLTGKYLNGAKPAGARNTLWPENTRYISPLAETAIAAYVALATRYGMAPEILAHAFVLSRSFLTASIVGATKIQHLDQAFAALEIKISDELEHELEALHRKYLIPAP